MSAENRAGKVSDLVGSIYDSVAEPDHWQGALGALCDTFTGVIAILVKRDLREPGPRFIATFGDPDLIAPLVERAMSELPFAEVAPRMELDVPMTIDDFYAAEGPGLRPRWLASPLNHDWALPNEIDDCIWLPVIKEPQRIGSLVMVTTRARPAISADDLTAFGEIAPHVRRAVAVDEMLETERRRSRIFAEALDRLSCAVLIVDGAMTLLYANPAGEEVIQGRGLVVASRGTVTLQWPVARAAVERAVHFGERSEIALGTLGIAAPLLPSRGAAVAHVMPLARREPEMRVDQRAAAAIFISWPDPDAAGGLDAIAALFGLTAAEKRVAGLVALGMSRLSIAEANGVLPGTVKSQLAAIFDKTGTADQRALAALVRDLTPPIRAD